MHQIAAANADPGPFMDVFLKCDVRDVLLLDPGGALDFDQVPAPAWGRLQVIGTGMQRPYSKSASKRGKQIVIQMLEELSREKSYNSGHRRSVMSKSRDARKEAKKKPARSIKEKRKAKLERKSK